MLTSTTKIIKKMSKMPKKLLDVAVTQPKLWLIHPGVREPKLLVRGPSRDLNQSLEMTLRTKPGRSTKILQFVD